MKSAGRYEIREVLGEGGMGIVYRALDPAMSNREVAVKTIKDPQDKAVLELFKRECGVLATLTHPNIVEIYDIGEVEEGGARRPYFVMPLLRGVTLQELINSSSPRLTVERSIQMIVQICKGLHAAHEHQLVHRDLKPSNLFVLSDDSVKVIDFGVAHLANHLTATGLKGTVLYMAPEQVQRKQPSALSDQFSVAVVCYEMLARRHPFSLAGREDLADAILHFKPPPVSDFNPLVSPLVSQVIHKALAKKPHYRFSSVREFSDYLQRALRNEPIDIFDPGRVGPWLERAQKAFDSGDLDEAGEIISELDAQNYLAPEIAQLQKQIEEARRTRTVKQLLETAQRRFNEKEYVRALQKVQEVLDLDPTNTEAFTLKGAIESKRSATQIEEWLRVAGEHLENHSYTHARQALGKVLDFRPKDVRAQTLLAEVERQEQEHIKLRIEKQQAYQSALHAYERGEVNSAINKLERLLDLDRRAPDTTSPEMGATYQKLYEEVRSKRDHLSYQEAETRRLLNESDFPAAKAICDEVLTAYPNNVLFRFLRDDVEQAERLEISAFIARVEREVAIERDLNRKVSILKEARDKYPSEPRLEQSLQQVQLRRDRVDAIAGRARALEEAAQFSEAVEQWQMLRSIYPQYLGLEIEIDRLHKRREQQARADVKAQWINQIDQALALRNYAKAAALTADALLEFAGDAELAALANLSDQLQARTLDAEEKANRGREIYGSGFPKEGLELLREAIRLDAHSTLVRTGLLDTLLNEATRQVDLDWGAAEPFVREALDLDPSNPLAKSLSTLIQDKRQAQEVSLAISTARELKAQRKIRDAIQELDKIATQYPHEKRLIQFRNALWEGLSSDERAELRDYDLKDVTDLVRESKEAGNVDALESIFKRTHAYVRYKNDADFRGPLSEIEERLRHKKEVGEASAEPAVDPSLGIDPDRTPSQASPAVETDATSLWDRLLRICNTVFQDARIVFRDPRIKVILLGVGSTLAVLALIAVVRYVSASRSASRLAELAPKVTTVDVKNASADEYRVLDNRGADVTDRSLVGLGAGHYELVASRSGFTPFKLPFVIDPLRERRKTLDVLWQAWPTELTVTVALGVGVLNVDGTTQPLDSNSQFTTQWHNGPHSISWGLGNRELVKIEMDVNDIDVAAKPAMFTDAVGILAVLTRGEVSSQIFDIAGGIEKVVGNHSEQLSTPEKFRFEGIEPIGLRSRASGQPLVELKPATTGQPMIYVYVAPKKKGTGGGKRRHEISPVEEADRKVNTASSSSAQPTEEQLRQKEKAEKRQKYLEELKGGSKTEKP